MPWDRVEAIIIIVIIIQGTNLQVCHEQNKLLRTTYYRFVPPP
jgi:hypothetical protein